MPLSTESEHPRQMIRDLELSNSTSLQFAGGTRKSWMTTPDLAVLRPGSLISKISSHGKKRSQKSTSAGRPVPLRHVRDPGRPSQVTALPISSPERCAPDEHQITTEKHIPFREPLLTTRDPAASDSGTPQTQSSYNVAQPKEIPCGQNLPDSRQNSIPDQNGGVSLLPSPATGVHQDTLPRPSPVYDRHPDPNTMSIAETPQIANLNIRKRRLQSLESTASQEPIRVPANYVPNDSNLETPIFAETLESGNHTLAQRVTDRIRAVESMPIRSDLELRRLRLLEQACIGVDVEYIVAHQLHSWKDVHGHSDLTEYLPSFNTKQDNGLSVISQLLAPNEDLPQSAQEWFAAFPNKLLSDDQKSSHRAMQEKNVLIMLEHLGSMWHHVRYHHPKSNAPILCGAIRDSLGVTSFLLQQVIFRYLLRVSWVGPDDICMQQCEDVFLQHQRRFQSNAEEAKSVELSRHAECTTHLRRHMVHIGITVIPAKRTQRQADPRPHCGLVRQMQGDAQFTPNHCQVPQAHNITRHSASPPLTINTGSYFSPRTTSSPTIHSAPLPGIEFSPTTTNVPSPCTPRKSMSGSPDLLQQGSHSTFGLRSQSQSHGWVNAPSSSQINPQSALATPMNSSGQQFPYGHRAMYAGPNPNPNQWNRIPRTQAMYTPIPILPRTPSNPYQTASNGPGPGAYFHPAQSAPPIIPGGPFQPSNFSYAPTNGVVPNISNASAADQNTSPNPAITAVHQAHLMSPRLIPIHPNNGLNWDVKLFRYIKHVQIPGTTLSSDLILFKWQPTLDFESVAAKAVDGFGPVGLPLRKVSAGSTVFRLRCVKIQKPVMHVTESEWVNSDHVWPKTIAIKLNGIALETRRKGHHGKDLTIDITPFVKAGQNEVEAATLGLSRASQNQFLIGIETVAFAQEEYLRSMIRRRSFESAKTQLLARLTLTDPDIEVLNPHLVLDITDPFTSTMISLPVRGDGCTHIQCFDLNVFLETRHSNDKPGPCRPETFKCPICKSDIRPGRIYIDEFFSEVQKSLASTNRTDVKEVILMETGEWTIKEPKDSDGQNETGEADDEARNDAADMSARVHKDLEPRQSSGSLAGKKAAVQLETIEILDDD